MNAGGGSVDKTDTMVYAAAKGGIFMEPVVDIIESAVWETFLNGLSSFSEDFLADGRAAEVPTERDSL